MKITMAAITLALLATAASAEAGDYKCKGNGVEKSGSTKFTIRRSGGDFSIEKSGSTIGRVKKSGSKMVVEISGSTKATIENGKIYKSGSTWAKVSDAQKQFECGGHVAASLWVLFKLGKLP